MATLREWYLRRILRNMPFMLGLYDEEKGIFRCEEGMDGACRQCLRTLAYLYANRLDDNPYYHSPDILEKVKRCGDAICDAAVPGRSGLLGGEWITLNLLETIDWLGEELGPERCKRWREVIGRDLELMKLVSNYISTAPNHFMWRAALLYRAGLFFDRAEWRESGRMLARQVCRMQTADGYWDEAHRGHGPSINYHRVHLHGLDYYYRLSGDEEVKDALYRGIEFAVRTAYPDGTPIETFDGRQPYVAAFAVGMAANALSRTAQGRRMLRRQAQRAEELGVTDAFHPCGFALTWYVFATSDFMIDCHRFSEEGEDAPLPLENEGHQDTFVFNGRDGIGGGLTARRQDWVLAVSAIESDVPRFIPNVYITERQTGFSLRHSAAGLIVGGGNRTRNHVPLANAIVLTGCQDVDCAAGVFPDELVKEQGLPGHSTEGLDPVKCCYHPIQRRAEFTEHGAALTLEFMHGQVRFDLVVRDEDHFEVRYAFETVSTKRILLQVPVPLFHPGRFLLDARPREIGDLEHVATETFQRELSLKARGARVSYLLPENTVADFTYAVEPIKNWRFKGMNHVPDVNYKPLYTVGLISREFSSPKERGVLLTINVNEP